MGDIYERSTEVFLWVGEYNFGGLRDTKTIEDTDDGHWSVYGRGFGGSFTYVEDDNDFVSSSFCIINMLATMTDDVHLHDLTCYGSNRHNRGFEHLFEYEFGAILAITAFAWWTRSWTIQEIVLPRRATVVCGSMSAPWSMFVNGATNLVYHSGQACCKRLYQSLPSRQREGLVQFMSNVGKIEETRKVYEIKSDKIQFCDVLWQFRHLGATNPRDKIYAFLSFATDPHLKGAIVPNYSWSITKVYVETTIEAIIKCNSLWIMHAILSRNDALPSWVPDWSAAVDSERWSGELFRQRRCPYHASGTKGVDIVVNYGERYGTTRISLRGIAVGTVSFVGETMPILHNELEHMQYEHLIPILYGWKQTAELVDDCEYVGGGKVSEAWWRTLTRDLINESFISPGWRRSRHDDEDVYQAWWCIGRGGVELNHAYERELESYESAVRAATEDQAFFLTERGYMGLGRPQVGDIVCVLFGGRLPFLLRPISDSEEFTLVGDCYVHGIMDGEVLEKGEEQEMMFDLR